MTTCTRLVNISISNIVIFLASIQYSSVYFGVSNPKSTTNLYELVRVKFSITIFEISVTVRNASVIRFSVSVFGYEK